MSRDLICAIESLLPIAPPEAASTILRRAIADLGAAIGGSGAHVQIALPSPMPAAIKPKAKTAGTLIGGREPAVDLSAQAMAWLSKTTLVNALANAIDIAATRHAKVTVAVIPGNHDRDVGIRREPSGGLLL